MVIKAGVKEGVKKTVSEEAVKKVALECTGVARTGRQNGVQRGGKARRNCGDECWRTSRRKSLRVGRLNDSLRLAEVSFLRRDGSERAFGRSSSAASEGKLDVAVEQARTPQSQPSVQAA